MKGLAILMMLLGMLVSTSGCAFLTGAGTGAVAAQEHAEKEHCGDDDFDPFEDDCD